MSRRSPAASDAAVDETAAAALPADPVDRAIAATVDAWFAEHFHGLGLKLDVELFNHLAASKAPLVAQLRDAVAAARAGA